MPLAALASPCLGVRGRRSPPCWPPTTAASGWSRGRRRLRRPAPPPLGFRLATVHLAGRHAAVAAADILRAAALQQGRADPAPRPRRRSASRVEQVGWVKSAHVMRLLPDTRGDRRRPSASLLAVWQHDGRSRRHRHRRRRRSGGRSGPLRQPAAGGGRGGQRRRRRPSCRRAVAAAADGAARRAGAGRRPPLGPAAEGRHASIQLPGDRRGGGADRGSTSSTSSRGSWIWASHGSICAIRRWWRCGRGDAPAAGSSVANGAGMRLAVREDRRGVRGSRASERGPRRAEGWRWAARRWRRRSISAPSKVACFIMKPDGVRPADRTITAAGVGYVQSRGVRGGAMVDVDEAASAIAQAVERAETLAGVSVSGVTVATAGGQLASRRAGRQRLAGRPADRRRRPVPRHRARRVAGLKHARPPDHPRAADRLVGRRPAGVRDPRSMFGRQLGLRPAGRLDGRAGVPDPRPLRRARPPAVRRRGRRAVRLGARHAGRRRDGPRLPSASTWAAARPRLAVFAGGSLVHVDSLAVGGGARDRRTSPAASPPRSPAPSGSRPCTARPSPRPTRTAR